MTVPSMPLGALDDERLAVHRRFGARLRSARQTRQWSQHMLAAKLELFPDDIAGLEEGTLVLPLYLLPELCTMFGTSPGFWLDMD